MWRRVVSPSLTTLRNLAPSSPSPIRCSTFHLSRRFITTSSPEAKPSSPATPFQPRAATASDGMPKRRVEDVMAIATGHEREEIAFELQGRDLLEMDSPSGPFGTKEAPAIVRSVYDKRIVGCAGGEREDEHDVVWFWLEKGKPHECPVCSQYFMLEVVGPGGPPDGHGDHDHH